MKPPPDAWPELVTEQTVQLETRPDDPYSINVWAVAIGRHVYVVTPREGTRWSEYIQDDPRVRLRVGNSVYPLIADEVSSSAERHSVAERYASKYDESSQDSWVSDAMMFRLSERQ